MIDVHNIPELFKPPVPDDYYHARRLKLELALEALSKELGYSLEVFRDPWLESMDAEYWEVMADKYPGRLKFFAFCNDVFRSVFGVYAKKSDDGKTSTAYVSPEFSVVWDDEASLGVIELSNRFIMNSYDIGSWKFCVRAADQAIEAGVSLWHTEYQAYQKSRPTYDAIIDGDVRRLMRPKPDDVRLILPEKQRVELMSDIERFFQGNEFYAKYHLQYRRGILLVGPPGNGKTTIVRWLTANLKDVYVCTWQIHEKTDGSEMRRVFEGARRASPTLLIIEDIDGVQQSQLSRSEFLNALDGLGGQGAGIFCLATTNYPDKLDIALHRPGRFDRIMTIDLPQFAEREGYLRLVFAPFIDEGLISKQAVSNWAQDTKGLPMASLNELFLQVAFSMVGHEGPSDVEMLANKAISQLRHDYRRALRGDYRWKEQEKIGFHSSWDEPAERYTDDALADDLRERDESST